MESLSTPFGSALGPYLAFWLALTAISTVRVAMTGLPIAAREPHLRTAVAAVSGVIGLALLQFGILRFGTEPGGGTSVHACLPLSAGRDR